MRNEQAGNVVPFSHEWAGTRRTILLAWPASAERSALVRALETRGHPVRTVDDSQSTLALLELDTWYAVVLHQDLPDGGGLWVARVLDYARMIGSIAENPLILVASSPDLPEAEWRSAGISHCLEGSPDADQILAAVSVVRTERLSSAG